MQVLLRLIALAVFPASLMLAQTLTGTWQGTLKAGKDLRIVFKVSTTDADALKGMLYSIDQPGPPVPATSVSLQGSVVKIVVAGIGGTYEGKMNAAGDTIAGTWTQGPKPLPLDLDRANDQTAWTIPDPPKPLKRMAPDYDPTFEVATIKPSNPDRPGKGIRVNGRNFSTLNTTLLDLITFAYGVHVRQIVGAPTWMDSDKFDLAAEPDGEGLPNDRQVKLMMQKLIAERFQLKFHRDKKDLSIFALTVAKSGPKLTKNETDPNGLPGLGFRGLGALFCRNASMADLAQLFQGAVLDRPVVDQTSLPGRYDFALNWTPDEFQFTSFGPRPPTPPEKATNPDLFTAIQQQLGLKLEATKGPAEILVIDHVEKPSAN